MIRNPTIIMDASTPGEGEQNSSTQQLWASQEFDNTPALPVRNVAVQGSMGNFIGAGGKLLTSDKTSTTNVFSVGVPNANPSGSTIPSAGGVPTGAPTPVNPNATTAYAFTYQSIGSEINTFTLTIPQPGGGNVIQTFTGNSIPGQEPQIQLTPGTTVTISVTGNVPAGSKTSSTDKFSFELNQVNNPTTTNNIQVTP
ncbi:hypothetical protein [Ferruginibacter albus]|uniref:hypothetical protein n=1 Tax=Ferruginibacter albus TaxID=2875540 RepID=UPI001CC4C3E5|nr:hypothetical protein [Ferruginibacter albus]UAY52837.1 hypothetical protein K9M53_03950 [Ferruginibacter albus]